MSTYNTKRGVADRNEGNELTEGVIDSLTVENKIQLVKPGEPDTVNVENENEKMVDDTLSQYSDTV